MFGLVTKDSSHQNAQYFKEHLLQVSYQLTLLTTIHIMITIWKLMEE